MNKRRPVTKKELVEVTLDRFSNSGSLTPLRVLAKQYKRTEAVISRMINKTLREGLVEVKAAEPEISTPRRNRELEKHLQRIFGALRSVIVTDEEEHASDPNVKHYGNDLHARLGGKLAELIARGMVFEDDEVIGVSAGRGAYFTMEALWSYERLRLKGATVGPLCGVVRERSRSGPLNIPVDANWNAAILASRIEDECVLKHVEDIVSTRGSPQEKWWVSTAPTFAFIGAGVLSRNHCLFKYVGKVKENLSKLISLCDRIGRPLVGDCANYLFPISPRGDKVLLYSKDFRTIEKEVIKRIEEVNEQLLTVNESTLRKARHLALVAGTKEKVPAIYEILMKYASFETHKKQNLHILCTDRAAAGGLIELAKADRKQSGVPAGKQRTGL